MRRHSVLLAVTALLCGYAHAAYVNFEVSHVHPIALTPSGDRLLAVNTPDALLEVFTVQPDGSLVAHQAIPVGMEPVTVVARSDDEAWVVNNLSDSVSIVDLNLGVVVKTLTVGDEPTDVAFAGGKAFVAVSSEDAVRVYALADLNAPPATVELFSRDVRALAVSNDGQKVYAVTLRSGNQTTVVNAQVIFDDEPVLDPDVMGQMSMGDMQCEGAPPPPYPSLPAGIQRNPELTDPPPGSDPPEVGLIVRWDDAQGKWLDEAGQDWSHCLRFRLPDEDLFVIDVATLGVGSVAHLGTSLFEVSVHPTNGRIYVPNTDARNFVRFEHPQGLQGHVVDNQMSIVDPANGDALTKIDLNRHIDRASDPSTNLAERLASISQPGMLAWASDGSHAWLTGLGSQRVFRVDGNCLNWNCVFGPDRANPEAVEVGEGPTGIVLREAAQPDQSRLYVLNRVSHSISIVQPSTQTELEQIPLHDPSDELTKAGRRFLYEATNASAHGDAACSSCHPSGDLDGLAWDLGNPEQDFVSYSIPYDNVRFVQVYFVEGEGTIPCQPNNPVCSDHQGFDPQKGPMLTQSLRGMAEPLHHRGDRPTFRDFNQTFVTLLGAKDVGSPGQSAGLPDPVMELFRQFALGIHYPPNPFRNLDDTLPQGWLMPHGHLVAGHAGAGKQVFEETIVGVTQTAFTCQHCHHNEFGVPRQVTLGGHEPSNITSFEASPLMRGTSTGFDSLHSDLKVLHLRNLYEKFGPVLAAPGQPPANAKTGYGYTHDGSVPDLFRFVSSSQFDPFDPFNSQAQARHLSTFLYYFPTGTRPSVGRQVTLLAGAPPTGSAEDEVMLGVLQTVGDLADEERHCELIASTVVSGQLRRFHLSDGLWVTDVSGEPPLPTIALRESAQVPVTFTCVPLESGLRLGGDRDEDAVLDGDDCAPADAQTFTEPAIVSGLALTHSAQTTLSWQDQAPSAGASVHYEVIGATITELGDSGLAATECIRAGLLTPTFTDPRPDPPAGEAYYYIVRAENPCGLSALGQPLDSLECSTGLDF